MTREQLVKKATAIAEKHFDEVGLETFRIAIKSEQCFDSDIEDFIESWEEGDGWSASTFLTTASTYQKIILKVPFTVGFLFSRKKY